VFALEEMFGMVSRYLVSIIVNCRLRTLSTRNINIEVASFTEIITLRRRNLINIISYYKKNLYHYFTHVYIEPS